MLVYAREFAGEAFSERDDPKLVTGESCVLCQQSLDTNAAARMREGYDAYLDRLINRDSTLIKARDEFYTALIECDDVFQGQCCQQRKTNHYPKCYNNQ